MKNIVRTAAFALACLFAGESANAAVVLRTYEYFTLSGRTAADLDRELSRRGPQIHKTGQRHPGATQLRFNTKVKYGSDSKSCRIVAADITIHARVHLPRWKQRPSAKPDLALIWDTLSADIKRHEESHIIIARTAAFDMERALKALPWRSNCDEMKNDAAALMVKLMKQQDEAQVQFDRVEGKNFERRFERLLIFRIQREMEKKRG
jgi:predicted secreted Zn-dependent protease